MLRMEPQDRSSIYTEQVQKALRVQESSLWEAKATIPPSGHLNHMLPHGLKQQFTRVSLSMRHY